MRLPSLRDPRTRVALGLAGLTLSGLQVGHDHVSRREEAAFRAVNDLPDGLYRPAWLVMQAGTIGAVPVAAALARVTGRRPLSGRLLTEGALTWLLAKAVKRAYRRPRPAALLGTSHVRGEAATGMGYVSGHAGVAVVLALGAWPALGRAGRMAALVGAPLVGTTRVYVGAHLPLDVLGGASLGLAVDGLVALCPTPDRGRGARTVGSAPC
jgi:undecaprenyl-diphosphatase